jgi:hypothetical protein
MPTLAAVALKERALWLLALILGAHALYAWSVGFHHTISDQYGFRQTQTALATRTILEGSPRLFYEVPIFGPPWALPLEFPLYQWLAALLAGTGVPLIEAGRAVSIGFFLLSLAAVWKLLGCFRVERGAKLAIICLILSCPIYLFWTRTFLIETCVLALSLWYVYFALQAVATKSRWELAAGALLGMLAGMVKLTTFLSFGALAASWLLVGIWQRTITMKSFAMFGSALIAGPVIAGYTWTELADHVNQANSLMAIVNGPTAERLWVFGTVSDRLSPVLWSSVSDRILPDTIGMVMAVPILFGLLPAARRYGYHALVSGALFLFPILAFPVLHRVHSYYQTENALFLNAACGFVAYGLIRRRGALTLTGFAVLLLFACGGIARYYSAYFPSASIDNQYLLKTGERVQRLTSAGQIIIVQGEDWSSEIPFYAHRRAIMDRYFSEAQLQNQVRAALPAEVGDILYCAEFRKAGEGIDPVGRLDLIQKRYGVRMDTAFDDGQCIHFTRAPSVLDVRTPASLPYAASLDLPKNGSVVKGVFSVEGWALSIPRVREIRVEIDGRAAASGKPGAYRPDLARAFPQYPGHPYNGFGVKVDIGGFSSGQHLLGVKAVLEDGSGHVVGNATISTQ